MNDQNDISIQNDNIITEQLITSQIVNSNNKSIYSLWIKILLFISCIIILINIYLIFIHFIYPFILL